MKHRYLTTVGLLVFCLWSCSKKEETKTEIFHPQAETYLEAYNLEYQKLSTAANEAAWALNTKIEEGDTVTQKRFEEATQALTDFTGSLANIDSAKKISGNSRPAIADTKKRNGLRFVSCRWRTGDGS